MLIQTVGTQSIGADRKAHGRRARRHGQLGFSTLEVLVATVMIATLVAGGIYYANIGEKINAVNLVSIKTSAVVRFPEAITTSYALRNTLANVTRTHLSDTGSVREDKPVPWAVVAEGNDDPYSVQMRFTLDTQGQAEALNAYLNGNAQTTLISDSRMKSCSPKYCVDVKYAID